MASLPPSAPVSACPPLHRPNAAPLVAPNGVHFLSIPFWQAQLPWLWHGFSTRKGGLSHCYAAQGSPGELNLGFTAADDRQLVAANRRLLAEAVSGSPATPLIPIRQIHSSVVHLATRSDADLPVGCEADGQITSEPGLLLAVQTADCIPVLVADRKRRVVAAFHAGWRGTVQRLVENGIILLRSQFGSQPSDLVAAIGPGIGACCYAVGPELLQEFESQFAYGRELFHPAGPALHLDLVEANRRQLLAAGLALHDIQLTGGCTSCQPDLFFSHRASGGNAGRMMSVIGIRPQP